MPRLVVIGGGYAGVLAAVRAARALGERGEVTLIADRTALVERIRLHETSASGRDPRWSLADLVAGSGVRLIHARADAVDVARSEVRAGDRTVPFDRLIVAIGSRAAPSSIPGAAEHARLLGPESAFEIGGEAARLASAADGAIGRRVVVIGGGLTGLELAAELAERHPALRVVIVTAGEIGERLCRGARAHVLRALRRLGVELREHTRVERIDADVVIADGEPISFELCVATTGFAIPELLAQSGLAIDELGRARVDAYLRAEGAPHVYVAGDCARIPAGAGSPVVAGCKTAMPFGALAADNAVASLSGRPETPNDWLDPGLCISLGRRDGVVQSMRASGSPRSFFLRGRAAAWLKELVCRYTIKSLELERDGRFRYRWLRASPRRARAALTGTASSVAAVAQPPGPVGAPLRERGEVAR
jgi:NADH dehydrogenase